MNSESVQVYLLYYVVGVECISLYLGPTKIQQSRLVVFIALWIPCNPGLVAPSMLATSAPTTVCTIAWLVDFIVFFGCGTHNSWSSCKQEFYVFCCCWRWQYLHRLVNLQISTCQNDMLLLQICISYWSFLILCCWSKLISWMLINRPHPMNGHILAKTVLNQRKKLTVAIEMKKSCCVMGLWVDRRDLGHQQNGQRTWF